MASKNKTSVIAEPGKQYVLITREFDAPRDRGSDVGMIGLRGPSGLGEGREGS